MKKPKLVKGAHKAWRWFSMQAMTLALVTQAAWVALPANLVAHVSDTAKTTIVVVLLIFGIVGRLVDQDEEENDVV